MGRKFIAMMALAAAATWSGSAQSAELINIDFSGKFDALPHLGFGNDPYSGTVTLDPNSRTYQNEVTNDPTSSMSIYALATLNGSFAGHEFNDRTGRWYFQRAVGCGQSGPTCSLLDINFDQGPADSFGARLYIVFNGTGPNNQPNPTSAVLNGASLRSFTLDFYNPNGNRQSLAGGQVAFAAGGVAPVPEPSTWLTLILGFGLIGAWLRLRNKLGAELNA